MTRSGTSIDSDNNDVQIRISLIKEIFTAEFGSDSELLDELINDIIALFQGKWETHLSCQTGYHNLGHALDVALLTARMIGGWNHLNDQEHPGINKDLFLTAIASALFHDSGYIKGKGDDKGTGGKYSFTHEARSVALAGSYLSRKNWPARSIELVRDIISITRVHAPLQIGELFKSREEEVIGRMMASADLVAQMADVDYMKRINDLYDELQEAYASDGVETLAKNGYRIFYSAQEMIDGTVDFYEGFVLPRLKQLGSMDQYLVVFFGDGRNPYQENITANLSDQQLTKRNRWRKLGDVLYDLGMATKEQIQAALTRQKESRRGKGEVGNSTNLLRETLIACVENKLFTDGYIGELLMDMDVLSPELLRQGLLQQVLPANMIETLTREELLFLLQISMLRQNICRGPWLLNQILEMTNKLLNCEGSHILLAKTDSQEMLIAIPSGPDNAQRDSRTFPADKGLAGWVFSHAHPAIVSNVSKDKRFDSEIDSNVRGNFTTESILAVPLHIDGELIGVMEAINKRAGEFSEHDLTILSLVTNVISVSLEGAFR